MKLRNCDGNIKIIAIIITIILVLIIGIIIVINLNKDKTVEPIEEEPYEYFVMHSLDDKYGVIDKKGNEIIENKYSNMYIPNPAEDVFFCFTNEQEYAILDSKGNDIFTDFSSVMPITISDATLEMEKKVLCYEENGKYGLVDYTGKKLTDAIYDEVISLNNKPGCIRVKKDELYGVLDSEGNVIVDVKYNSVEGDEFSSQDEGYLKTGYIISEKTNTGIIYGYIDYNGKELISPKYESITRALKYDTDDINIIYIENGKKDIKKNKKTIIKPRFQSINYYTNSNIFVVDRNGKYGFYDIDGKEILKPEYETYSVAGNYISVKKGDESRLYDLHGNLVNTNIYKSIIETENPSYFIAQTEDGFYSIISKDVEIKDRYTFISYAFDNFFIFTNEDGLSGVLNIFTGIEIPAEYENIILLENATALEARKGQDVEIYSKDLQKTLTMTNGIVESVGNGYISVYSDTELKYVNTEGNIVPNTEVYPDLNLYSYQTDDGKWGFADKNGNIVVECKYDRVTELNEYGFAGICQSGKWGVIDSTGKVIVVPEYEIQTYYSPNFIGKYLLEEQETIYCIEPEV